MQSFLANFKPGIKFLLGATIALIAATIYVGISHATPTYTFSGTLKDQNGAVFSYGVSMKLRDAYGNFVWGSASGTTGEFSIPVQPGVYSLELTGNTPGSLQSFTLSQPIDTPTIDLTSSNVTQDITLNMANVDIKVYNAQGYLRPAYITGRSANVSGSSVSLYPGGPAATNVYVQSRSKNDTGGATTFQTFVGTKYTGASETTGMCAKTSSTGTLIGCNPTEFTAASGTNAVDLPNTPPPRNTFSGTLKDQNGAVFSYGASIKLRDAYGNSVLGSASGTTGEFSIPVQPGVYSLEIQGSTPGDIQGYTLSQPIETPTIDLTSGNVVQDLTLSVATVDVNVYNPQGYLRSGSYITGRSANVSGSSVSLYPGGPAATNVYVVSKSKNTGGGAASTKTFLGTKYTGADSNTGICGYTSGSLTTLIGCNSAFTAASTNAVDLPNTPVARNTFSGTLKDQNGTPFGSVDMRMRDAFGNVVFGSTAADGSFSIGVQPGMYAIFLNSNSANGLSSFNIAQPTTNPTVDLTSGNMTQDLTIPTAMVNVKLYDALGNPRTGYVQARTYTNTGSSIQLYPGAAPATEVNISTGFNVGLGGTDFKSIVGTVYGTGTNDKICAYTASSMTTLIGCNATPFTVTSGANGIALPKPSAPTGLQVESPTSNPLLSWQALPFAKKYFIYRDGVKIGNSVDTTFNDNNVASGLYEYKVSALDAGGNESILSAGVSVTVVQVVPQLATPTFSKNPVAIGKTTNLKVNVTGNLHGISGGEYYTGSIDPGVGNGTAIAYSDGALSVNLNIMNEGVYTYNLRAQNNIGWSPVVTISLTVFKPTFSGTLKDQNGAVFSYGVSMKLRDAYGNFVWGSASGTTGEFSIPVQPGVYSLELTGNTPGSLQSFTLSQPIDTPTIDLTSSNVTQDITLNMANVDIKVYNAQGYLRPAYITGRSANVSGSSVSLYPGGPAATNVYVQSRSKNDTGGATTFQTFVGTKYTGASETTGMCAKTSSTGTLIGCNPTEFTAASGTNAVDLPNTPPPRNTFSGTLKDQNGAVFSYGASIKLRDAYGNSVLGSASGTTGEFSIPVQPGVYSLEIQGSTPGDIQGYTLSQPIETPTIDLTSGNVVQDLTLSVATVDVNVYNPQGYLRSGSYITGRSANVSGSSVSLYPGGPAATNVYVVSKSKNTGGGAASTKTFLGTKYTGADSNTGICGYTSGSLTTLIGCNSAFTAASTNAVDLPNTPVARNTFSGTLKDQNGTPFGSVDMRMRDAFGNVVFGSTAADGSFSIGVQPGMYAIFLNSNSANGLSSFNIAQPTTNPTVDLTSGNMTQDLTIPTAMVNVKLYDALGNPRTGYVQARTYTNTGSSIQLYPGAAPATEVNISTGFNVGLGGTDFKSIVGTVYGTGTNDKICAYTASSMTTLIGCNATPFTVTSGANGIALP